MEIMKPNLDGITECNTIKGVIREAKIRDMDVACCFFNKCYEANVETDKMEFSSCEFKDCICLNSKFEKVYFTDVLWPDFNEEELNKAIYDYQNRNRRFGGLNK